MKCPACSKQLPSGMVFCPWDGHALESSPPPEHGGDPLLETQVSEYIIKERIGAGGMGIVYRAVQPLIGKQVAIKVLKSELAEAGELVKRLLVEARVVNAIQHRGVIDIFGFGQLLDGRPYVVMELLHGESMDAYLRKRVRLGAIEAAKILDEMLAALGAAHRGGVIHRDLKPGNVFLKEEAEGAHSVKLLDFGIAKVTQSQTVSALTMSGHILGTPEYMAPEQIRGEKVEPTADLYAVGVIAFQMLTGRRPFIGEQMKVLFAQVEEEPPKPSRLAPEVPLELERIVLRLLAKRPAQRFQSAEEVRRELDALLSRQDTAAGKRSQVAAEPVYPPTVTLLTPVSLAGATVSLRGPATAPGFSKPSRSLWVVGLGAASLLVASGVVGLSGFGRGALPPEPPPVARVEVARAEKEPAPPVQEPPPPQQAEAPKAVEPVMATQAVQPPPMEEHLAQRRPSGPPRGRAVPQSTEAARTEPAKVPERNTASGVQASPPPPGVQQPETLSKSSTAKASEASAPMVSPEPTAPAATPNIELNPDVLQQRLADAAIRLSRKDQQAVFSPAMARLMEIQKLADAATTGEQCMKLARMLEEWERQFLSKR